MVEDMVTSGVLLTRNIVDDQIKAISTIRDILSEKGILLCSFDSIWEETIYNESDFKTEHPDQNIENGRYVFLNINVAVKK